MPQDEPVERRERDTVVPLELFFDLVFVYAFTQVTMLLNSDPTWGGVLRAGLLRYLFMMDSSDEDIADAWESGPLATFRSCGSRIPTAESAMTMNWKAREPEKYAAAVAAIPGGRLGDPELDIGRPLVQLVQRASEFSGKTIHLSAGGVAETVETITQEPIVLS